MLFFILAVLSIGLFALYSATREYYSNAVFLRQAGWMLAGLLTLFIVLTADYHRFVGLSYVLYAINIVLLVLVLFIGQTRGGAHRWINLGVFNLQPSELVKITLILALSAYMGKRKNQATGLKFALGAFLLAVPAVFLILIEPDLGGAVIFIPVIFAMLFMAGAKVIHLAGIAALGFVSLPFLWHFLRDYQKQRLFVFLNPNIDPLGSGYTVIQSKIAVGSGGVFGKGWLSGTQNQLNFLPERHTDFIFSVIGEEWGFLGALVLLLAYLFIIYRAAKILENTPDVYGRLIVAGFLSLFALQVIVNIGMAIGFLPIVGLTLPLVSYGGSSLIVTLMSLGFILNVGMRRSLF